MVLVASELLTLQQVATLHFLSIEELETALFSKHRFIKHTSNYDIQALINSLKAPTLLFSRKYIHYVLIMEAWLSELEMSWNEGPNLSNNLFHEEEQYSKQNEDMDSFSEELAAVLGDDFSFTNFNAETNISSLLNCTIENPTNLLGQCDQQLPPLSNDYSPSSIIEPIITNDQHPNINNVGTKNSSVISVAKTSGRKRRRDPEQVQGHILAERKRRELLSIRFIALSAMIPGLKKIDKTSILEEAIKHLQQMQDRVKTLEEATSKPVVGSITVVKRKQIVMNKDTQSSVVENVNGSVTSSGGSGDGDNGNQRTGLPEIEVKLTPKTLLLKICCFRRKGILGTIYKELEIRGMIVLNSNIMVFETSTLDITILAKIEKAEGHDKQVKDLLRTLHSTLRV